jgi:hypothetical protein
MHCCKRFALGISILFSMCFMLVGPTIAAPTFIPTGTMVTPRYNLTLTLLPNGKVLATGGINVAGLRVKAAELYDPTTGTWSATGSMLQDREKHTATLLQNGKVLVAGGLGNGTGQLASAEIYDPVTGAWASTGTMLFTSSYHSAVLLNNGKVLVAAGVRPGVGNATGTNVAELYDPQTGTWAPTGSLSIGRYAQDATLLLDGTVLIAGGTGTGGSSSPAATSAERYNPATGTWTSAGSMPTPRWQDFTLTRLGDGRVLVAGGNIAGFPVKASDLYNPLTGQWAPTAVLPGTRASYTATALSNGTALLSGGYDVNPSFPVSTGVLFDPNAQIWTLLGVTMAQTRSGHAAVLLPSGRVLIAGGHRGGGNLVGQAELFDDGIVLKPVLTLDITAPTALTESNGQYNPNPFTVVATVTNTGEAVGQDLILNVFPPPGLSLVSGLARQTITSLGPGQQQLVSWTMFAAGQARQTTLSYFVTLTASNAAGKNVSAQLAIPAGGISIQSVSPNTGGNTGSITVQAFGGGFLPGATAKLKRTGEPDITGTNAAIANAGFTFDATFELAGKALGMWDLVVTNPGGTLATLSNAITVETTRAADVWVETLGHPFAKTEKPQLYTILYGNAGNVDANFVSLWVAFPAKMSWSLLDGQQSTASVVTSDGNTLHLFDVPLVAPGQLGTIRYLLTLPPPAGEEFRIWSWTDRFGQ